VSLGPASPEADPEAPIAQPVFGMSALPKLRAHFYHVDYCANCLLTDGREEKREECSHVVPVGTGRHVPWSTSGYCVGHSVDRHIPIFNTQCKFEESGLYPMVLRIPA
jgi:hypothetical protein